MILALALSAALTYGAADFFGGFASKRTAPVAVVVLSQLAGFVILGAAWFAVPGHFYWSDAGWGIAAGAAGAVAIGALYAALAVGRMGVVSPITAVIGASIPVLVGFALGERPSTLEFAGVGCAFVAVALISSNGQTWRMSLREPGLGLALLSGLCIGGLYVFLARGHRDAGLALLVPTRITSVLLLLAFALLRRQSLRPAPRGMLTIVVAGALDMSANVLYVTATRYGFLAIAAVLTSLYPASTVFLARMVLGERLAPAQWFGVGLAVAGVILIAA